MLLRKLVRISINVIWLENLNLHTMRMSFFLSIISSASILILSRGRLLETVLKKICNFKSIRSEEIILVWLIEQNSNENVTYVDRKPNYIVIPIYYLLIHISKVIWSACEKVTQLIDLEQIHNLWSAFHSHICFEFHSYRETEQINHLHIDVPTLHRTCLQLR